MWQNRYFEGCHTGSNTHGLVYIIMTSLIFLLLLFRYLIPSFIVFNTVYDYFPRPNFETRIHKLNMGNVQVSSSSSLQISRKKIRQHRPSTNGVDGNGVPKIFYG